MSLQSEYYESLAHHGVKGMKWGVRRYKNEDGTLTPRGKARYAYKDAKKEYRSAKKVQKRAGLSAFGVEGLRKFQSAEKNTTDAYVNMARAKAEYARTKAKNEAKADKAELDAYARAVKKHGLAGSGTDRAYGGTSTALLNDIQVRKGEDYMKRVEKTVQAALVMDIAAAAVTAVGLGVATAILEGH